MTVAFATHIEIDREGIAWIAGTKVKVTEIVLDKMAYGWNPEDIRFQHPHLSLAQIHGALTYYYENQREFDAQIERDLVEADELAFQASDPEFRRRLVELKQSFRGL